jgi:hypothetical protein
LHKRPPRRIILDTDTFKVVGAFGFQSAVEDL